MRVYAVMDRKYMSLLKLCRTTEVAEKFIRDHGREADWFFVERDVLE